MRTSGNRTQRVKSAVKQLLINYEVINADANHEFFLLLLESRDKEKSSQKRNIILIKTRYNTASCCKIAYVSEGEAFFSDIYSLFKAER